MTLPVPSALDGLVAARLQLRRGTSDGSPGDVAAEAVLFRVPSTSGPHDLPDVLGDEERARAARLRRRADRRRYEFAHVALRLVLARQVDVPAASLQFTRGACPACGEAHGRPRLTGPSGPEFSLSRSGAMVAVAVADVPVGVDVQERPGADAVDQVVARLHPRERDAVEGTPGDRRAQEFARLWVRKEAYLKGVGTGIGQGTASSDLTVEPPGWMVTDTVVERHAAALACVR